MSDERYYGFAVLPTSGTIDEGTMCLHRSPLPGILCKNHDYSHLESELNLLKAEGASFGWRFIKDAEIRQDYIKKTNQMANAVRDEVSRGSITPYQGAKMANQLRNDLMDSARLKSSDIGRASAQAEKITGKALWELEEKYAQNIFKKAFASLSPEERNIVWGEIVNAAGRPQLRFTAKTIRLSRIGRGFILASLAFAVYDITTAEDKPRQIAKEGTTAGAGVLGSMAGGAAAGLACGPGAPVCVAVGVFVGGALAALGADFAFDRFW